MPALIDPLLENPTFIPFSFSRNKLQHTIDAADPTLSDRSGLKYFLEIQIPEYKYFGDFSALRRSEGREVPVSSEDGATYAGATFVFNDVAGKLDGCLEYVKPTYGINKTSIVVEQTMQYRLRELVQQEFPEVNTDVILPASWIIKAGLSPQDYQDYSTTFFNQRQLLKRQFLTWQPNNIFVGQEDRWLSFLINFTPRPTAIKLKVRHNIKGADAVIIEKETINGAGLGQIVMIPVGVSQLGIPDNVYSYDVWLSDQNDMRISEVRTYYVDRTSYVNERAITFVNSLGGWDTIRFTGAGSENLKITKQRAERERPADAGIDFADVFVVYSEGEEELIVSTGLFERQVIEKQKHIQDLLFSSKIYLQTNRGHLFLDLNTNTIEKNRDRSDIISYTFSFRKSGIYQNYSNAEAVPATTSRPTGWRALNYTHVLDAFGKRTGRVKPQQLEKYYLDDNTKYKPYTVKPNVPGTEGFIDQLLLPNADEIEGTTPYPSAEINRLGSYTRAACDDGGTPGPATILILAGKYGGEKAGDADALAELEAISLDTQAYANQYGACYPDPWSYVLVVPVNKAHFRISAVNGVGGTSYGAHYVAKSSGATKKGNAWWLQLENAGQPDVYVPRSWDIELPTNFAPTEDWKFGIYGAVGTRLKVYVNGIEVYNDVSGVQSIPEMQGFWEHSVAHALIPSQAKVYLLVIPA